MRKKLIKITWQSKNRVKKSEAYWLIILLTVLYSSAVILCNIPKAIAMESIVTHKEIVKVKETKKQKVVIGCENCLALKNNNPGNLVFANQIGATKGFNGFAMFDTPEEGYNALINQIKLDQKRNMTLRKFIAKYAPPHENDSWLYMNTVCDNLKSDLDTKIGSLNTEELTKEMARFESQTTVNN